jgi:serine/threonine-protein kinase
MSPEQARGEGLDVRTDVYGLGAVLYEMVTGTPPFAADTLAAAYARLLTESVPRPSVVAPGRCPPGLDELLDRALAKRREDRFPDARAFSGALARLAPASAAVQRVA